MSKLPGPQYLRQAREKRLFAQNPDWPWSWHFVYNPMGKILYADADSVYLSYITRIHNLDGFLRLVSLQLAIKQSAIRDADVPTFLERAEPMLRNPYTNEPMLWDAERHAIYFDGIGERLGESLLDKRVEVRL